MKATIYRTDGSTEEFEGSFEDVKKACNYEWAEVVQLRRCPNPIYRDKCMLVDEEGLLKPGQKINKFATELYHSVCIPGTSNPIVGDVALVHRKEVV